MALPRRLSAGRIPGLTASPVFAPASDILNYYFLCNQAVSNPFQQVRAAGEGAGGGGCGWGLDLGTPEWEERRRGVGRVVGVVNRWALLPPSVFSQRLTLSQRALANIHSQLQGLEREAVPQFPSAQVGGPGARPTPQLPDGGGGGAWSGGRSLRKGRVTGCGRGPPKGKAEGCEWGPGEWGGRSGRGLNVWVES